MRVCVCGLYKHFENLTTIKANVPGTVQASEQIKNILLH